MAVGVVAQSQRTVGGADDIGLGLWGDAEFLVKVHVFVHGRIIKYEFL